MKKIKLLRVAAVTVFGLSLGASVASAAPGTGTIGTTGPNSNNQVTMNDTTSVHLTNKNNVKVSSHNPQIAWTGDANVSGNTTGGSATSGAASNNSMLSANLSLSNASSSAAVLGGGAGGANTGTINNTGPSSNNQIQFNNTSTTTVSNTNNVSVESHNFQVAASGSANVSGNTTGGSATSGAASNTSATQVTMTITN